MAMFDAEHRHNIEPVLRDLIGDYNTKDDLWGAVRGSGFDTKGFPWNLENPTPQAQHDAFVRVFFNQTWELQKRILLALCESSPGKGETHKGSIEKGYERKTDTDDTKVGKKTREELGEKEKRKIAFFLKSTAESIGWTELARCSRNGKKGGCPVKWRSLLALAELRQALVSAYESSVVLDELSAIGPLVAAIDTRLTAYSANPSVHPPDIYNKLNQLGISIARLEHHFTSGFLKRGEIVDYAALDAEGEREFQQDYFKNRLTKYFDLRLKTVKNGSDTARNAASSIVTMKESIADIIQPTNIQPTKERLLSVGEIMKVLSGNPKCRQAFSTYAALRKSNFASGLEMTLRRRSNLDTEKLVALLRSFSSAKMAPFLDGLVASLPHKLHGELRVWPKQLDSLT